MKRRDHDGAAASGTAGASTTVSTLLAPRMTRTEGGGPGGGSGSGSGGVAITFLKPTRRG